MNLFPSSHQSLRQGPQDTFPPKRALEARQPWTRWPPLTPWRAALKDSIHLWGLKAPLSPAGRWWGRWGGSRLNRKECVWRSCPQGSSLQVPTRSPSGPLIDPVPFPPLAPSRLRASPEGGDCWGAGKPRPILTSHFREAFLGLGAVQHLGF